MKNNKAFTLVEVVAVITILGVILAIAVPRILSAIDESKRATFEISANKLLDVAKKEYSKNVQEKEYTIEDGEFVGESFKLQGELPDSGSIKVLDDGTISFAVNNDKWCAIKRVTEDKIQVIPYDGDCIIATPVACFTYTKTATEVTITGYDNSCVKDVAIPSRIDGLPVTTIGSSSFFYKQITSVNIPNSIITINSAAFFLNNITHVKIPDSVRHISNQAFSHNQLTTVILSKNLTNMGQDAFAYNVIESIDIPSSLSFLHSGVFASNRLTSLTIPTNIKEIWMNSFLDNQLTSVTIPSSVIILSNSFSNNQLPDSDAFFYARNSDGSIDNTTLVSYGGAKKENIVIPSNVKTIANYAFQNGEINSITIPTTVTNIGYAAFSGNNLTSINIPNTIPLIRSNAFYNNRLTNVTIPNNVTKIETDAFSFNSLANIVFPNSLIDIDSSAFNYNSLTNITIPSNVTIVENSISQSFYNTYNPQKLAGTYTAPSQSGIWTKQ